MGERLFIAVWPPDEVVAQIHAALEPTQSRFDQIRWQPPQRWHVTLAFLGDRSPDRESARLAHDPTPRPSPASVCGAGRFGPILWLGVGTGPWLTELAGSLRRVHEAHERRFTPHITVGRGRSPAAQRQIGPAVAELSGFRSGQWTPTEYTLVRSTIGPTPAYEVIARRPLAGADS